MAQCSFGKVSTKGVFTPTMPYGTDLYGRMLYLRSRDTRVLITAFDFLGDSPALATRFRQGVSEATGIPAENIWFHELQIHAAPVLTPEEMERLIALTAREARAMMERAREFRCDVAELHTGDRFSMNREQLVPGLGGVTVWTGLRFDERRRPFARDPGIMLLRGYRPNPPILETPVYFDEPVDPKAYLFVFRDTDGQVIGTLSRFAAHPDVAVLFEQRVNSPQEYHYDFDWPGYLSESLEREFGAPSLYLNGPCADLSVRKGYDGMDTYRASAAEAKRIGEEIARALLERYFRKRSPLGDADNLKAATFTFELPMRENLPFDRKSPPDLDRLLGEADDALERAKAEGAPAYQIKQLIDDRYRVPYDYSRVYQSDVFSDETLARHTVTATVSALRLGDFLFIGVPGESLCEMGRWLRETFTGAKTIPVDEVNGYYDYMATPASLTKGGYTYWQSWVSRDAVPTLKEGIVREMEDF